MIEGHHRRANSGEVALQVLPVAWGPECPRRCVRRPDVYVGQLLWRQTPELPLGVPQDAEQAALRLVVEVQPRERRVRPVLSEEALEPLAHRLPTVGRDLAVDGVMEYVVRDHVPEAVRRCGVERSCVQLGRGNAVAAYHEVEARPYDLRVTRRSGLCGRRGPPYPYGELPVTGEDLWRDRLGCARPSRKGREVGRHERKRSPSPHQAQERRPAWPTPGQRWCEV